ncbi:MAG: hypothetical protein JW860_06340 [Sedimentisphaerales bacterium]|nr:hypothetical protein [Sedimentisphaerales bacterium]
MKAIFNEYHRYLIIYFITLPLMVTGTVQCLAQENPAESAETLLEERMTQRITYSCTNLPIEEMLMQLTELADVDIIQGPDVTGNVTAKVTNVPLEEALNNILAAHGYGYIKTENMLRVVPISEILAKEEEKKKIEEARRAEAVKIMTAPEKYITKYFRLYYANVEDVANALSKFRSQNGAIAVLKASSTIMITELESRMNVIDQFIEEIDRVTPQIMVEVRIYDITHRNRLDLGVEWGIGTNTVYDVDGNPTGGRLDPFLAGGFKGADTGAIPDGGLIRVGILNDSIQFDALIQAQEAIIDAELLANPRIQVLDNETASFDVVTRIPYKELSSTSGGMSTTTTEFEDVGVQLSVTPHVTRDGLIRIQVVPQFSLLVEQNEDGAPTVDLRSINTFAMVKDGQTIVLGGLRKKENRTVVSKIPLLGDIPLLGLLFRTESDDIFNSELVVFITPRIIETPVLTESESWYLNQTDFSDLSEEFSRKKKGFRPRTPRTPAPTDKEYESVPEESQPMGPETSDSPQSTPGEPSESQDAGTKLGTPEDDASKEEKPTITEELLNNIDLILAP